MVQRSLTVGRGELIWIGRIRCLWDAVGVGSVISEVLILVAAILVGHHRVVLELSRTVLETAGD